MTTATLLCILTVLGGCYLFLYLAGKQMEFERKDYRIRQWHKQQEAENEAEKKRNAEKVVPTFMTSTSPASAANGANASRPTDTAAS